MQTDRKPQVLAIGPNFGADWLDHLPDIACVLRADGRIVHVNAAACRTLGYRRTDLLSLRVWDIDANRSPEQWQDFWDGLLNSAPLRARSRLRHRGGQLLPVELDVGLASLDNQPHGVAVFRENPEQDDKPQDDKLQDDKLEAFEHLQRMLDIGERMALIGHWSFDLASRKLGWSEQMFRILQRDQTLGEPAFAECRRCVRADALPALKRAVIACARDQRPYDLLLRIQRDDGSSGHVRIYGAAMSDADSTAAHLIGLVQDISERKALEQALCESEADYRLLVEEQTDLVVKVDAEGRSLFVSPGYCRVFGKREDERLGQVFMPLVHQDDRASTEAAMAKLHHPPHRCYLEQRTLTVDGWRWLGRRGRGQRRLVATERSSRRPSRLRRSR